VHWTMVFAWGAVARTASHEVARPGHFMGSVMCHRTQRQIFSRYDEARGDDLTTGLAIELDPILRSRLAVEFDPMLRSTDVEDDPTSRWRCRPRPADETVMQRGSWPT
jgi:hypothetical protein